MSKSISPMIFFAVPIRNRAWCLDKYLQGLLSLDYPKYLIHVYFLVNDSNDDTLKKLQEFKSKHCGSWEEPNEFYQIDIENINYGAPEDNRTALVTHALYPHFAKLKNHVREKFLASDCDYWLQVDSDNPCRPDTLRKLLRHDKAYVAGWCNTSREPDNPCASVMYIPRFRDDYERVKWNVFGEIPKGKLMLVDWVGGIVLIRRDAAEACSYHASVPKRDDTLGFCREAQAKGFNIYVDPEVYLEHYMIKPE